jgi:phosphoglycolate phosphatase
VRGVPPNFPQDHATTLPRPDTVLFDLDGTLIDSGPSILAALRKALAEEGLPALPPDAERSLLGPPLYRALPPLVGDAADRVVRTYRRIFVAEGFAYRATAYPGIEALLDGLARHHVRLAVSTSKLETSAVTILEHLGLAGRFATICGDTQDAGRPTKAEVIAETLRRIGESPRRTGESPRRTGGSPRRTGESPLTVMVGDRSHDVIGAREQGLSCLGAGWGYGSPGELETAGAVAVLPDPAALAAAWQLA